MSLLSSQAMVLAALSEVRTLDLDEARQLLGREDALFVDLREADEIASRGCIPGALHVPRGLLEFQADPDSPWHEPALAQPGRCVVLYCGIGWRSALAALTLQQMGMVDVCHLGGGFAAWKAAGAPVDEPGRAEAAVNGPLQLTLT